MPEYSYICEKCDHSWSIFCHRSKYKDKRNCPSCKKKKAGYRNFQEDEVYAAYNYSLSEAKTIGHYADKQSKKLGKNRVEDMIREQKTKKEDRLSEKLTDGMKKMDRPDSSTKWTKESTKKRRKKNR